MDDALRGLLFSLSLILLFLSSLSLSTQYTSQGHDACRGSSFPPKYLISSTSHISQSRAFANTTTQQPHSHACTDCSLASFGPSTRMHTHTHMKKKHTHTYTNMAAFGAGGAKNIAGTRDATDNHDRRVMSQQLLGFSRLLAQMSRGASSPSCVSASRDNRLSRDLAPWITSNSKTFLGEAPCHSLSRVVTCRIQVVNYVLVPCATHTAKAVM
jgi:hypothetical protein